MLKFDLYVTLSSFLVYLLIVCYKLIPSTSFFSSCSLCIPHWLSNSRSLYLFSQNIDGVGDRGYTGVIFAVHHHVGPLELVVVKRSFFHHAFSASLTSSPSLNLPHLLAQNCDGIGDSGYTSVIFCNEPLSLDDADSTNITKKIQF
ncbi:hypothetical protein JHK87_033854 [Glycine soja]|nr:hypothetical protein JHK87_033854 [Glycine soja]